MSDDDLTTAYMAGFHQRVDEVAALKAEIERLRGLLREWLNAGRDKYDDQDFVKRVREALGE